MVVHQLQAYLENQVPEAQIHTNLKDLIKNELSYADQVPTLVVEECISYNLFPGPDNAFDMCNQRSLIKKRVNDFVESLISSGANLIVVLRGTYEQDPSIWFRKHKLYFEKNRKASHDKKILQKNIYEQFDAITRDCFIAKLASIKKNHYKVFRSIKRTHEEVAEIAVKYNCFAVIGQDSNYLIYEGVKYYISAKSINLETLDCIIYDRNKLMMHLGLKSYHMPFFATLCGNDIVNDNLTCFHKRISKSKTAKFLAIAQILKCLSGNPYKHIGYIVNLINHPQVDNDLIKRSLDMYLNNKTILPKNKILRVANELKQTCKWSSKLYVLFIFKCYRSSIVTALGDLNLLPAVILLRELRKKIYGILLFDENVKTVTEYCLDDALISSNEVLLSVNVSAVEPEEVEHPGFFQLLDDETQHIHLLRWNLFCSCFSKSLKHSVLKYVPRRLLLPVLALHYLKSQTAQQIFQEIYEIEMFLVVAILIHENIQSEILRDFRNFMKLDLRVQYLFSYYIETCHTLKLLSEACGSIVPNEEICMCNFFDEFLLCFVYETMKKGTKWDEFFNENILLKALFLTLMDIVLETG